MQETLNANARAVLDSVRAADNHPTALGLSEESFPNPWVAALSATISTAIGAFIPIIPFFFMQGIAAVIAAALISLVAHFVVGAAKTLVTGRSWFNSGMEMAVVGAVEAIITYVVGATFKAI